MSLPKYPEYKPSGVEWLGDVPAHWEIFRMASLFRDVNEPGNDDLPVLSVSIHDGVSDKELDENEMDRKVTRSDDRSKYKSVMPGDLTYNMMRAWQGGFGTVGAHGMVSPAYVVARPVRSFMTFFVEMILRTQNAVAEMKRHSRGVTDFRLRLYWEEFKCIEIALPPEDEQSEIVHFIRYETAKIDALIAEQEKLIHLLAEKRQATISHAVTRGLDPAAPMKDSGVAWLGEVPAHWSVCSLRRVIAAIEQGWSPECHAREAEAGEWGVLKAGCLNGGVFRPTENKALPPELTPDAAYEVRVGDVLMSRASGSPELVGSTALVKATRPGLMLSDKIFRLRLQALMTSRYFVTALNSRALRTQIENALSGGNGMANNLPQSNLLTFSIPVPTMAEQEEISDFVENEMARLDALRAEAERAIALLKERRAALIAAAVTGQIDVRQNSGILNGREARDAVAALS
jgi:type I restriction enzyme S subunit